MEVFDAVRVELLDGKEDAVEWRITDGADLEHGWSMDRATQADQRGHRCDSTRRRGDPDG